MLEWSPAAFRMRLGMRCRLSPTAACRRTRPGQLCADSVEKVFFGWRSKILRTADALRLRRREGPRCFTQNRSRTFVAAPRSVAAAEKSKKSASRNFRCRPIFDFCNTICQYRKCWRAMDAAHPSRMTSWRRVPSG